MSFFELQHIFVVFPPGAGGNFLSTIIKKIIDNSLSAIELSSNGNAHANSLTNINFNETLSCGIIFNFPSFQSFDDKFNFYKQKIEQISDQPNTPCVAWTHDFSNIELYQKLYPNSKIIAITQRTTEEQFIVTVQQELKNRLESTGIVFLDDTEHKKHWKAKFKKYFSLITNIKDVELIDYVADNLGEANLSTIHKFVTIEMMLRYYSFDFSKSSNSLFEYCFSHRSLDDPNFNVDAFYNVTFSIGRRIDDFIDYTNVLELPFALIKEKNVREILTILENLFKRLLTLEEKTFVINEFDNYYKKQEQHLLEDFKFYYSNLKQEFVKEITRLKNDIA
jgi:predicted 3-demethylubiquinone-9 3-methyltransferase (glyoxalase superfamily)